MIDNNDGHNNIEESVIAKSTGNQEEEDIAVKDAALYNVLNSKKKMTKQDAGYREQDLSWILFVCLFLLSHR